MGSRLGVGEEALIVHLETALAQAIHTPGLSIVTLFCNPAAIFRANLVLLSPRPK